MSAQALSRTLYVRPDACERFTPVKFAPIRLAWCKLTPRISVHIFLNQSQGGMYIAKRVRDMAGPYSSYRIRNRLDSKASVLDAPKPQSTEGVSVAVC